MTEQAHIVRLGTRASALARRQTDIIAALLCEAHLALGTKIVVFSTRGDQVLNMPLPQVGGKGLFTAELEDALRRGEIDLAVHSLKDLPTEDAGGLIIGAIPARAPANDVLVSRQGHTLDTLPEGAVVGSSSHRRAGQLLNARPDLRIADIRGNVDTRVRKALDALGPYDAIMLAQAGLDRLGHSEVISQILPFDVMLPAPGQGALAVQCRDEAASRELLAPLDHLATRCAVLAERAFLAALGGGCSVPVAAYGTVQGWELRLQGRIVSLDGSGRVDLASTTTLVEDSQVKAAAILGQQLADMALQQGAATILEAAQ